ncbi:MAG: universal stress protein [Sulfobacillus sp.]
MMNRVAVAVDGSPASLAALKCAMDLVKADAALLCVDVKDMMSFDLEYAAEAYEGGGATDDSIKEWDKLARQVGKQVKSIADEYHVEVVWHILTVEPGHGGAALAFVEYAKKWGAEVLFVGQHHGSRLVEDMFGSFPRWVATHSHLPTMVVPPPVEATTTKEHDRK